MKYNGYLIEEEIGEDGEKTGCLCIYTLSGEFVHGPFVSMPAAEDHIDNVLNADVSTPPKSHRP